MNAEVNHQQDLEYHIINISEKLEAFKNDCDNTYKFKLPIGSEIRSIDFWKSVIIECLASFFYVFIVYGAGASVGGGSLAVLSTSISSGLTMMFLTESFVLVSGAHINPAVSLSMGIAERISVLRCCSFIVAQCGGAIAGAAFFYGVIDISYRKNLIAVSHIEISERVPERFGIELVLTFVVVFAYFIYIDGRKKLNGPSSLIVAAAYSACSLVSIPHLNPARSLGASFVLNKWKNHWIYWIGSMTGGVGAGLVYKYIFKREKSAPPSEISEDDSVSIRSDDPTYDDVDKPAVPKHHGSTYNTYRPGGMTKESSAYCLNTGSYSTAPTKVERVESLYGGTKSLYCKSPPLTRANLNRSQSLYSRSNGTAGNNRETIPKPGPLAPAQSLYSIKLNQQNHVQNQNVQNQLQHRSESVYGVRSVRPDPYGTSAEWQTYGRTVGQSTNESGEHKTVKNNRPDSMYGILDSRVQYEANCGTYNAPSSKKANSGCNYSSNNIYGGKPDNIYSGKPDNIYSGKPGQPSAFRAVRTNNSDNRALPSPNTKLLIPSPVNNSY